jgi:hypothetical protein
LLIAGFLEVGAGNPPRGQEISSGEGSTGNMDFKIAE